MFSWRTLNIYNNSESCDVIGGRKKEGNKHIKSFTKLYNRATTTQKGKKIVCKIVLETYFEKSTPVHTDKIQRMVLENCSFK